MKVIYKYPLAVQERLTLDLPVGAKIIRVDDVEGRFWLWAIVDDGQKMTTPRYIECYKTGQPMPGDALDLVYLGCCRLFIMQELCLYMFERLQ